MDWLLARRGFSSEFGLTGCGVADRSAVNSTVGAPEKTGCRLDHFGAAIDIEIPEHIAEQHSRMAFESMRRGQRDRAHAAVDRAFATAAEQAAEVVTLGSHIDDLFAANTVSALNELGIETVGDLIGYSPQELATVRNINWKTIGTIQAKLAVHGFQLGADPQPANSVSEDHA